MNRTIATLSKGLVIVAATGALASVALVARNAEAQWIPPPPEVVASSEPIWYEGHAHYWYGGHWYWRDEHGGWQHYEHEPVYFQTHRYPVRRYWGAGHRW